MITSLHPQDRQPTGNERHGYGDRLKQSRPNPIAEGQAENSERGESDRYVQREPLRRRVAGKPAQERGNTAPVLPAHGEDRAGLYHDRKHFRALSAEAEFQ